MALIVTQEKKQVSIKAWNWAKGGVAVYANRASCLWGQIIFICFYFKQGQLSESETYLEAAGAGGGKQSGDTKMWLPVLIMFISCLKNMASCFIHAHFLLRKDSFLFYP